MKVNWLSVAENMLKYMLINSFDDPHINWLFRLEFENIR